MKIRKQRKLIASKMANVAAYNRRWGMFMRALGDFNSSWPESMIINDRFIHDVLGLAFDPEETLVQVEPAQVEAKPEAVQQTYVVARKKDHEVVGTFNTEQDAQATIDKAAAQKKAKLYIMQVTSD